MKHCFDGKQILRIIIDDFRNLDRQNTDYNKISNISHTLAGNNIVDHSDVVGASPVGAAPTTSSFSTQYLASVHWVGPRQLQYKTRNI